MTRMPKYIGVLWINYVLSTAVGLLVLDGTVYQFCKKIEATFGIDGKISGIAFIVVFTIWQICVAVYGFRNMFSKKLYLQEDEENT